MNARKIFINLLFCLFPLILVIQISYAQDKEKSSDDLKIDKTILSITSVDTTKTVTFDGRIYSKPFKDSELMLADKKIPFEIEISDGNFMGIISVMKYDINIKVKIEEFYQGGLVLKAENSGHRILVRRKNNWAVTEKLN